MSTKPCEMTKEEIEYNRGYRDGYDRGNLNGYELRIAEERKSDCYDCVSRQTMLDYQQYLHGKMSNEENHKLWRFIKDLPPVTTPTRNKCKWILYDYRTLVPREHGDIPNPYWRIPARYKTELKYCPYCGGEIDYSEVDEEIGKRGNEE